MELREIHSLAELQYILEDDNLVVVCNNCGSELIDDDERSIAYETAKCPFCHEDLDFIEVDLVDTMS